ncbi:hypothetical protein [Streptomyces luteogriseus]|uniref:hypothetical protein n=1 Tax=Streptomyces luteogriseus TaxID=68233 RepID=UPI00369CA3DA
MAKTIEPGWGINLGRDGLRVEAGRHLQLSMSLTVLFWLISVATAVGSGPFWTQAMM